MSERVSDAILTEWWTGRVAPVNDMAGELLEYRAVGTPEQCAEWKRRAALNEVAQIDHEIARPTFAEALVKLLEDGERLTVSAIRMGSAIVVERLEVVEGEA